MAPGSATLDVYEEGNNLIVEAHVPGMKPEDVDVIVEGGMLMIRGETKAEDERRERIYLIREHRRGSFVRTVRLPGNVDPDKVKANFDNGVLRIELPRSEQLNARRIPLTSGSQQQISGTGAEKEQKTQRAAWRHAGRLARPGEDLETRPGFPPAPTTRSGDGGRRRHPGRRGTSRPPYRP